jgi:hypothetical protein
MKLTLKIVTLISLSIGCLVTDIDAAKAASIIDFDDLSLGNFGAISNNYGSNLSGTPDIAIQYRTLITSGPTLDYLSFWQDGYSDLKKVAFSSSNGSLAEISFIPTAGYSVVLNSFDLGGYLFSDVPDQTVRIVDEFYNVLQNYSPFNIEGNSGHSSFNPNITHAGILRIQFGPDYDTGIDNIRFDQSVTNSIPTPALLPGLIGMGAAAYRKRKGAATAKT